MKLEIKIDGKTYVAEVEILNEDESQPTLALYTPVSGHTASAPIAYAPAQANLGGANEKQYCSPVNGLVIRVDVKPGQMVQPNEVLLVLEAMKMENNVVAHHAGTVKRVEIASGDSVKLHQVLIEME